MKRVAKIIATLIILFITGCNNKSLLLKIEDFDVNEVQSAAVIEWIDSNKANGIYLSRSKNEPMLYLYVNYANKVNSETYKVASTSIGYTKGENNIVINAVPKLSDETSENLFIIHYLDKKVKGVNLNNTVLNLDNITEID